MEKYPELKKLHRQEMIWPQFLERILFNGFTIKLRGEEFKFEGHYNTIMKSPRNGLSLTPRQQAKITSGRQTAANLQQL